MFGTPLLPKLNDPKRAVPGSRAIDSMAGFCECGVSRLALGVDEEVGARQRDAGAGRNRQRQRVLRIPRSDRVVALDRQHGLAWGGDADR